MGRGVGWAFQNDAREDTGRTLGQEQPGAKAVLGHYTFPSLQSLLLCFLKKPGLDIKGMYLIFFSKFHPTQKSLMLSYLNVKRNY